MRTNLLLRGMISLFILMVPELVLSDPAKTYTNSIAMEFVLIPSGSFMMGADIAARDVSNDETPQHPVAISQPFYLGKYEVTQAQWMAVMEKNPSTSQGATLPVENVSWLDVQTFIQRLNAREGSEVYRLPTEAEWEYAARAGTNTTWYWGNSAEGVEQYAWYKGNSNRQTHPVGQLEPNAWGLYDMLGNVWEWVMDRHDSKYYAKSPRTDPTGPSTGPYMVYRGGSCSYGPRALRSANRIGQAPDFRDADVGFRLARTIPAQQNTTE
ncbi:MAG: formylglycine-generating enzyme family protein [Magnetococcales bacterium]|nr:formylglycine-generating enzyme family protein [Magnetococcales bacterium]